MNLKHVGLSVVLIFVLWAINFSQATGRAEDVHSGDEAISEHLRRDGVKYETERAIVWAEKGLLEQLEIEAFGKLLNQGIIDLEKYTGLKFDKKYYGSAKMEYFISAGGIARGSTDNKPHIYIPAARVREKKVPYLHETAHKLAYKSLESLWLAEGYATFVQSHVAAQYGGYDANPFNPENADMDQLAKDILKTELSKKLLPLVGLNGLPAKMSPGPQLEAYRPIFEDRRVTARAFYILSTSFVKFLVGKVGIKKLEKVFNTSDTQGNILKVTGRNTEDWKTQWLSALS
jgi:hypothetical protein